MRRKPIALAALAGLLAWPAAQAHAQHTEAVMLEMRNLAQAMEIVWLDTGFFTTIENLDDTNDPNATPSFQYINDGGGALVLRPNEGVPFRRFLTPQEWQGPYIGGFLSQRMEGPEGDYDEGTLLDLFGTGSPYYFYSPLGLIEPKTGGLSLRYYGDLFDRYTIVSHGANGIHGSGDLFYQFGGGVTVPTISSARLRTSELRMGTPFELMIRGYNLGNEPAGSEILFDGEPAIGVSLREWTPTEVIADAETFPPEGTLVSIGFGTGGETREVPLTDETEETAVSDWALY